eukprot:CAMPEP_0196597830 /NCGR_PEP_ID=MMETSP1081-20130531/93207_1 /TAXON_ID=36882 /ORGANISM="Pyramimonas amylifera, Strain CCMP720" /LENGTH=83 /DNA_ID=CAMNT_0041923367 /DNA_START=69 /DNA_END=316 /DNA_ORIENTATION=+
MFPIFSFLGLACLLAVGDLTTVEGSNFIVDGISAPLEEGSSARRLLEDEVSPKQEEIKKDKEPIEKSSFKIVAEEIGEGLSKA